MKVRLKQFDFEVREHGLIMFQFHEGPIKTLSDDDLFEVCSNVSIP